MPDVCSSLPISEAGEMNEPFDVAKDKPSWAPPRSIPGWDEGEMVSRSF